MKNKSSEKFIAITDQITGPIGLRFTQQINENVKGEAFVNPLPESNHNVIESYTGELPSVFLLLNSQKNKRVGLRFNFLENLLQTKGNLVVHIKMKDQSLEEIIQLIYRLDWLALFISDYKNINSVEIPNIDQLKEHLKNH